MQVRLGMKLRHWNCYEKISILLRKVLITFLLWVDAVLTSTHNLYFGTKVIIDEQ